MNTPHHDFGKALRLIQARDKVRNETLANALGVEKQQITRWRNAKSLKGGTILALCQAMGTPLQEFYSLADAV